MQKIRLRTKFEIISLVAFTTIMVTISAAAITRTITDTSDTLDTYIRNSNGKYWEVSEANIQAAINDLGTGSGWKNGIVWIAGNNSIILNTGIVLSKYVTLDLQGSYLDIRSNVDGVTMAEGSILRGGTIDIRNYVGTYTHAAVLFDGAKKYWTGSAQVQNMFFLGDLNEGAAIQYQLDSQGEGATFTSCRDIYIHQFRYGILINVTGGADSGSLTYANSNTFGNIKMIYPTYGIYLHRNTGVSHGHSDCDGNMFDNIIIQTGTNTQRAIYAEGRYNIFDNIFVWDWGVASGIYCYEFPTDAENQFLKFFGGSAYYKSNGTNNFRTNMALNEQSMVRYNQASEPDIPTNTMAFWCDTDAGPKYYIIQDFGGTQKKAELI